MIEYLIVTSHSSEILNKKIKDYIEMGWKPVGSHQVVIINEQLRYAGSQHTGTIVDREYSQTMIKESGVLQEYIKRNEK